jgi:hypothetical protein
MGMHILKGDGYEGVVLRGAIKEDLLFKRKLTISHQEI